MIKLGDKMEYVNKVLWLIATVFMMASGIYFTIKLKGIQFNIKKIRESFHHKKDSNITPFDTLMLSTAAKVGVGSIAGIALAIYIGGVGTIFWVWISSILLAPNSFVESCLGVLYRKKDNNNYIGGPSYYMDYGLNQKNMAVVYAILTCFAYILGFLTIQSNTIAKSLEAYLPSLASGIIIAIITFLVIYKGLKGISKFSNKLVPIMGLCYLLVTIIVSIKHFQELPTIFMSIVKSGLNLRSASVGFISTILIGIQRGVFSNEAGLGTSAIASSTADTNNAIGQGLVQIVGVYFTSLIVCTSTALIIMTSDYQGQQFLNMNGIELAQFAFREHFGSFGNTFLIVIIVLFSFSTIVTGYYYGESNLKYLLKEKFSNYRLILVILTLTLLIFGSVASPSILWNIVDILVALMAILNVYTIFCLREKIFFHLTLKNKQKK